ncbi:Esterase YbfF [Aquimixticola soesokkakensis]|uniref:Esterase YbfF n=1 Tax=Aquimixticola soesokkakensis TaxID=1519096 RepID=A0A1Y5TM63_9RHOB|nr:alpha/beta fold hydrolase [Aquimixticola soesokkakensis]SLN67312.1 Esterase YbfF [Aquimixticola soesokkakensis]
MLNFVTYGTDTGEPPLLIVHGLFGSARNLGVVAKRLSDERLVIAVDQRNHGDSFRAPTQSYADMAGDVAEVLEAQGAAARPFHVMGHSMGGKAAMMLALTRPDLLKSLVVADIAPVAYEHSNVPLVDAMKKLDLSKITRRSQADEMLAEDVLDDGVRAFLLQSLDIKGQKWLLNLDVLRAEMPKIVGWPEDVRGTFDGPAFFLSGAQSTYVLPEYRPVIKGLFPKARFAKIEGTGHWLHAEKPREFEGAIRAYIGAVDELRHSL